MKIGYQHGAAICFGWTLTVWSTVFSHRTNEFFDTQKAFEFNPDVPASVMGYGGFPMRVFEYPMPPLGPGPSQSMTPLLANFFFWFAVAYLAIRWSRKPEKERAPLFGFALLAFVASTLFWFAYMLLRFD